MRGEKIRGSGPPDPTTRFEAYLSNLKQRGGALLIAGEAPEQARIDVSQKLFGTTDPEIPRRRVLVNTDPGIDGDAYLPSGVSKSDDVRVVQVSGHVRGAAATAAASGPRAPVIDHLADDVEAAFPEILRTDTPAAGELRVGVTSLQPLIDFAGLQRVEEWCTLLVAKTRAWKGIAHLHYPLPPADDRVATIGRHVDARIDLRIGPQEDVEWRWHTGVEEIDSWLSWMAI